MICDLCGRPTTIDEAITADVAQVGRFAFHDTPCALQFVRAAQALVQRKLTLDDVVVLLRLASA